MSMDPHKTESKKFDKFGEKVKQIILDDNADKEAKTINSQNPDKKESCVFISKTT